MKPLKIGLAMQGGQGWIGGMEYIRNIVLALAHLPEEVRCSFTLSLICRESTDPSLYRHLLGHLNQVFYEERERQKATFFDRLRWKIRDVVLHKENYPLDPFLEKEGFDFVYPYFSPGRKTFRSASWIYDFQHKYFSEFFPEGEILERNRYFGLMARHAQTIVVSSEAARNDVKTFYPEASSKAQRLSFRVFPAASWYEDDPARTYQEYALPERFFFVSNQFWRHKNHFVIFEALKRLRERSIYPVIVCTGHLYDFRQPSYSDLILGAIHKSGLARQVYLLGMISRRDQIQLLRRSLAVIQPSLFEGWSTVVEEARCLAKRIILSDLPVHREQNPEDSFYFDPNSADELSHHLSYGWDHFSPGPELKSETSARSKSLEEVQTFAKRFIEIARGDGLQV